MQKLGKMRYCLKNKNILPSLINSYYVFLKPFFMYTLCQMNHIKVQPMNP